jgi:hypothetical protein
LNQPSPAIVAQGSVRRLPRWALLIFCFAYILPGFIGREPWRSADISAFGVMADLVRGEMAWLAPHGTDATAEISGLLPYWLGAWAMKLMPAWVAPDFAARIPFLLLLTLSLLATWNATYYLARSPRAQPVAFAFGGEARPTDYARALADGGLLAFIACLGLAQLSHETTAALAQLSFCALSFYAVAAMPYRHLTPALAGVVGLTGLALSGAPTLAVLLGLGCTLICLLLAQEKDNSARHRMHSIVGMAMTTAGVALMSSWLGLWHWQIQWPRATWEAWQGLGSLLLWFTWPAWPLVLWTLWHWRRQLMNARISLHLALPLWFCCVTLLATVLTPAGDRALLLALPALATLAAFALPTLGRSVSALIDWFTLLFFSTCVFIIWVVWLAMQTGYPPQPALNVARLAPGFTASFSLLPFLMAALATGCWGWLVRWRVGRHRAAIWKSLVLPAGGAALCWLLLTTLWMPLLDFGRSYKPLVQRIEAVAGPTPCIETLALHPGLVAALKFHSTLRLQPHPLGANCPWLVADQEWLAQVPMAVNPRQWVLVQQLGHPKPGEEDIHIYQRIPATGR